MNISLISRTLGLVLLCETAAMAPSLLISLYYGEGDWLAFVYGMAITGAAGLLLTLPPLRSQEVGYREGFTIATLGWLLTAAFGSLPFIFYGNPAGFADAFFETMSGFTTTGASVLTNIEALPHGLLFWRSMTHWLGGLGTIVLILALIPSLKIAGMQLYRAEASGPTKAKVLPRIMQTTRQLYKVYLIITGAQVVLLLLAGLPLFDSFIHTFGTVATGGFSSKNMSIGAYNSLAVELIVAIFMLICGMNFALHYNALRGNFKVFRHNPEVKLFLGVIATGVLLISINLVNAAGYTPGEALRASLFTVTSITTTTGFATADFDRWPELSRMLLLLLMFLGGCAGSTAGSIKVVRILILYKSAARQISRLLHPQAVIPLRLGREVLPEAVVDNVQTFFFLFLLVFASAAAYLTWLGLDLVTAISAAAATLCNVGPGLALVGPMANYAALPGSAKLVLSFCMLLGRLEIYTVLVALSSVSFRRP